MANRKISQLTAATTPLNNGDLFVLEQNSVTKKLTAIEFLDFLAGHGGIASITLTSTSGLDKEYTITFDDGTDTTFTVSDGNGIASITYEYAIGDDSADPTSIASPYSGTMPTATDTYPFLWTRITLTPDVGSAVVGYACGKKGLDGATITSATVQYGISSSGNTEPSTWYNSIQTATTSNPYVWTKTETVFSDGTDQVTYTVSAVPYIAVNAPSVTTVPTGSPATATVANAISGAKNTLTFTFGLPQGAKGDQGDYIEPILSYGTSTSANTQPSIWYNSPTAISYVAGNFIWRKTEFVLHEAQTVQDTKIEIIGFIGASGGGTGTVTMVTFNGDPFYDDGTGNVSITADAADVGAIAEPSSKSDGQVLTWDNTAQEWVAQTPSTGSVNSVNNIGPSVGTTNVALKGTDIPIDSTPTPNSVIISDASGKLKASAISSTELGYLDNVTSDIQTQLDAKQPASANVNTGVYKYYYVDGVSGSDSNDGLTDATPFKTLDKAFEEYRTGLCSDVRININANGTYTLSTEWFSSGSIHINAVDTSLNPLSSVVIQWDNPSNNIQFYGVHVNIANATLSLANTSFRIYFEASTIALSNVEFTEKDTRFYFCGIDFTDVKFKTVQFFHCNGLINKLTITNTSLDAADDAIVIQHGSNIALYNNVDSYGLVVQALSSAGANQLLRVLQSKATIATAPKSQTNYLNGIYSNGSVINISTALKSNFNTYSTSGNITGGVPSIWVDTTTDLSTLESNVSTAISDITGLDTRIDNLEKFTNYQTLTGSLNQITDCGVYYITNANTNIPNGTNGTLIVLPAGLDANNRIQIFRRLGTIGTNDGNLYVRRINSSSLDSSWWQFSGTLLS